MLALALAQAPPAGTELPAAGMLVSVVSLADHRYVPLGERADGTPVYAVYTDAAEVRAILAEEAGAAPTP